MILVIWQAEGAAYLCTVQKVLFLCLAAFLVLRPMVPVIEYVTNYQYISKVLCENKDKPQMNCKGKCHLKKNLKKTFEAESAPSPDRLNFLTEGIVLFLQAIDPCVPVRIAETDLQHQALVNDLYAYLFSTDLLHPPAFS